MLCWVVPFGSSVKCELDLTGLVGIERRHPVTPHAVTVRAVLGISSERRIPREQNRVVKTVLELYID
jgi:hypothetical protein